MLAAALAASLAGAASAPAPANPPNIAIVVADDVRSRQPYLSLLATLLGYCLALTAGCLTPACLCHLSRVGGPWAEPALAVLVGWLLRVFVSVPRERVDLLFVLSCCAQIRGARQHTQRTASLKRVTEKSSALTPSTLVRDGGEVEGVRPAGRTTVADCRTFASPYIYICT